MSGMILPERTFDIWVSLAVARMFPSSLLWAPTTNAQAYREQWDLEVNLALGSERSKILFFENKGVDSYWNINIDMIQLAKLIHAWQHRNQTIWYTLPCTGRVSKTQQHSYIRRLQNNIGDVARVFTPLQICDITQNQIFDIIPRWFDRIQRWLNAILQGGGRPKFPRAQPARIHTDCILPCATAPTLNDFLESVAKCEIGEVYMNTGSGAGDELITRLVMQEIADRIVRKMEFEDVVQALTTDFSARNKGELMERAQQLDREIEPEVLPKFFQIPMSSVVPYRPRP